jgi:aldose 1-epimerase
MMSGPRPRLRRESVGETDAGTAVERYVLDNGHLRVSLLTWGATVQSLAAPDRSRDLADVVLGFDDLDGYLQEHPYLGAVIGRYANRIARGRFSLDGVTYEVPVNDRGNALHGGPDGFHRQVWAATPVETGDEVAVAFRHVSPNGAMGFPGALRTEVTYTLHGSQVRIDYRASTDAPTVLNLTQHTYFNLAGSGSGSIEAHELQMPASRYLPVDLESIPLGQLAPVEATPFDFRQIKPVGSDIDVADEQLERGLGYDHSWVLDRPTSALTSAAQLVDRSSGRVLDVLTTEPAVQFYSGNQLDGTLRGKGGRLYGPREGLCLETQHLPDSPNQPHFPNVVLRPGEDFHSTTVWRFSTT